MNSTTIRNELRMLSAIVDGWTTPGEVSPLERDMVLEKLRRLYELVRFAEIAPAVQESEPEMAMSIDLDDVLLPGVEFLPEIEVEDAPEHVAESMPEPEPASESPFHTAVSSVEALASVGDVVNTEHLKEEGVDEPAGAVLPDRGDETAVESQPVSAPHTEVAVAPVQSESFDKPVAEAPSSPAAPATLFGIEEDDAERHRRKQRVIMSLYHTEAPVAAEKSVPAPAAVEKSTPTPAPEVAQNVQSTPETALAMAPISEQVVDTRTAEYEPETEFEEFSVETLPASEVTSGSDAAPADESFEAEGTQQQAPDADGDTDAGAITNSSTEPAPKAASGSVLGDVINHDVQTLSDTFAPRRDTLSEAAHRAHIDNLRAAIGINDRFLLVRDLFDGDAAACDAALETLNAFGNLDDCMIHIAENYTWNPNSDGVKLLTELLERKHA